MLFGRRSKGSDLSRHIIEQYVKAAEHSGADRVRLFELLFSALSHDPAPDDIAYIGRTAADLIRGKDAYFVVNLMHYCYVDPTPADLKQWKKHCTPDGNRALLICGTAHPNGYFRERCLRSLAGEKEILQFVLLRINDWVPQIRRLAQEILHSMLCQQEKPLRMSEILSAMPFVEHIRRGRRARGDAYFSMDTLDHALLGYFAADPDAVLRASVTQRRLCYRVLLLHPERAYDDLLLYFIRHERDGAQRSSLVRCYLNRAEVTQEQLETFQQDKYWRVRLDAYEYRMKTQGSWDGLEQLLLSRSYPIREFAAYYLELGGFDSAAYCRGNLPDSILALCDLGTKEDIPLIRPYLETCPRESLVALVRLGAEDSEALLWKYMHADNAKLAKTAYRLAALQPRFAPVQLLPEIESQTDPQLRWRLIRLLDNVGDWNVLPLLIRLVRDYTHIRPDILNMIRHRTSFRTQISPDLAREIRSALDYTGTLIPPDMAEDILFDVERLVSP